MKKLIISPTFDRHSSFFIYRYDNSKREQALADLRCILLRLQNGKSVAQIEAENNPQVYLVPFSGHCGFSDYYIAYTEIDDSIFLYYCKYSFITINHDAPKLYASDRQAIRQANQHFRKGNTTEVNVDAVIGMLRVKE